MATVKVRQGATSRWVFRWAQSLREYVPILTVMKQAPLRISAPDHGVPNGWPVWFENASGGLAALKAAGPTPTADELYRPIVIDADTLEFNVINARGWRDTPAGATLVYYSPLDITGAIARMQIRKDAKAATPLLDLDSALLGGIVNDVALASTTVTLTAAQTALLPEGTYVTDVELLQTDGTVLATQQIEIEVSAEVTR